MSAPKSPFPGEPTAEVSRLIEVLHETGQRLEELTAGEVDAVADRLGRTVLLRRAQDYLRYNEAAKQAAILNALPAHIALLDSQGRIVSVNETWRRFAGANALLSSECGVGLDYLDVCDSAHGDHSAEAHRAAAGIRSVLAGTVKNFSLEYPCHSPTEQRWFLMAVTPLVSDHPNGAVVLHLDVTAQRQAEEKLRTSEFRFRQMAENIRDVFFLLDAGGTRLLYVSPAYEKIFGRSCESVYANPDTWIEAIHPDDRAAAYEEYLAGMVVGEFEIEYRIVRPDGSIRWIGSKGFPVHDDAGGIIRITGIAADITEKKGAADELRRSENLQRTILEASLDCVIAMDLEGKIVEFNPAAEATFGLTREQTLGKAMVELIVPPRWRDAHRRGFAHYLATGKGPMLGKRLELEAIRADGTEFSIELVITATGETSTPLFAGFIRDITARKAGDAKIRRLNRVHAILSGINSLIVRVRDRDELFGEACRIAVEEAGFCFSWIGIVDPERKIVPVAFAGANEPLRTAIHDLFASSAGALHGNTLTARAIREKKVVVSNDSQKDLSALFPNSQIEFGIRSLATLPLMVADEAVGVLVLYAGETEFFHDEELTLLRQLADDIALAIDHLQKQARLDYMACYDTLTGLANRGLFLERTAQSIRSAASAGRKLAVLLIDLERFKNINDSLGQSAGDALLRQVAEWLTRAAGDIDLVARVGTDHFAVLLPEIKTEDDATQLLEKTLTALAAYAFTPNDVVLRIGTKAGVALFPDSGPDADTLFRNAETALKKAKVSGDRYLFHRKVMTETAGSKVTLETQLRQAVDQHQFVLHYQPKVNLASGKVTGAEALIRWNHPRTGLMAPGRFIHLLEETGLIYEVGNWALCQAIEDYLRWRAVGLAAVRIAVNLSPLQLRHRRFLAQIEQVIGVDAQAAAGLELEITESVVMGDVTHSITTLKALRAMGIGLSIDDFGTGFSSLSYLAKLPVDTLKIDRSFVMDMTATASSLALVSTIVGLGHALDLKVVAEGVETEEQSRLLRAADCDEMQGFLFSKPVPCELFETRFLAPLCVGDESGKA